MKMGSLVESLGFSGSEQLIGISEAEVAEIAEDQGVGFLPGRYVEFLRVMGRKAGPLLVGTDAFYPGLLAIKNDAFELLVDNGVTGLVSSDAVVIAMHQGYQIYWMLGSSDDPLVCMYQEGDDGIAREWTSFTDFLHYEASKTSW